MIDLLNKLYNEIASQNLGSKLSDFSEEKDSLAPKLSYIESIL